MTETFSITVPVSDGALNPSEQQKGAIRRYLKNRDGRAVTVKFSKPTSTRSLNQNRYYWSVVLGIIADSTGNTTEDLHLVIKDMFLPRKFLKLGTREIEARKTTTELTPTEFEQYLERVRAWAAQELGINIPLPS